MVQTGISGHVELMAALRELAEGPTARDIDDAATDSLRPMLDETKTGYQALRQPHTPAGTHLDQGIIVRKIKGTRKRRLYWLGATRRARKIAHLVEFGTAPHWQPRRGVMHPGARPKPRMTQAFEANKVGVERIFATRIWQILQRKVLGLSRKGRRRR